MTIVERSVQMTDGHLAYSQGGRSELAGWERQVEEHLPLVRRIARRTAESIQRLDLLDDLLQAGFFGLVEAARRYSQPPGKSQSPEKDFPNFARQRIQGAMIDEVRRQDWRPRRISRFAARVSRQMAILEQRFGRAASEQEVARGLGMTLRDYQKELGEIEIGQLEALIDDPEDRTGSSLYENGETWLMHQELAGLLAEGIEQIPVNERQLLDFFYQQGMHQCEIALVFGVTEARISQLHKQVLLRLRAFLQKKARDKLNVTNPPEISGADQC